MILEMSLFVLAFAGMCWCLLVAHREGLGEPIRMVGRWLIAFADTLEDTREFASASQNNHQCLCL